MFQFNSIILYLNLNVFPYIFEILCSSSASNKDIKLNYITIDLVHVTINTTVNFILSVPVYLLLWKTMIC
jgi:hypothetical protein